MAATSTLVLSGCGPRLEHSATATSTATPTPERPAAQLAPWAKIHAVPYEIPEIALESYAYAASAMDRSAPGCHIGWPTLAAIGAIASDHGSAEGATLSKDAAVAPALRGLTREHMQLRTVADTDGGRFDGDLHQDVPMGPMQIMPSVWEQWSVSARNGAAPSPDNLDDAALSVARLLCAAGGDLSVPEGWAKAVGAVDSAPDFVSAVHDRAAEYSR